MAVRRYIRRYRAPILNGPDRRENLARSVARSYARASNSWESGTDDQRAETASFVGRTVDDLTFVLSHVLLFALLPRNTITRLFAGLGESTEPPVMPWPTLNRTELDMLRVASQEMSWSGPHVLDLQDAARLEKAKGGVRRFTLTTPQDWYDFSERHQ